MASMRTEYLWALPAIRPNANLISPSVHVQAQSLHLQVEIFPPRHSFENSNQPLRSTCCHRSTTSGCWLDSVPVCCGCPQRPTAAERPRSCVAARPCCNRSAPADEPRASSQAARPAAVRAAPVLSVGVSDLKARWLPTRRPSTPECDCHQAGKIIKSTVYTVRSASRLCLIPSEMVVLSGPDHGATPGLVSEGNLNDTRRPRPLIMCMAGNAASASAPSSGVASALPKRRFVARRQVPHPRNTPSTALPHPTSSLKLPVSLPQS